MANNHCNDIGGFMDEDAMHSAGEGSCPEEPLPSFEQVLHFLEDEVRESSSPVYEGIEKTTSPALRKETWALTVVSSAPTWTSKMHEKIVSARDSLHSSQLDKPAEDLPLLPPPPDSSLPPMPPAPGGGGAEIQGANSQTVTADGDPLSHPDTAPVHPTIAPPHPTNAPAGGDEENVSNGAATKGTGIPAPITQGPVQEEKFEKPMVFEAEFGNKDPSKGQSSKRHNTTPTLISGALEETNAIPTITGASSGSSKIPGQGYLIDPTEPTLILAAVLTILTTFWSLTTAFKPVNSIDFTQSLADARSAAHGAGDGLEEDGHPVKGLAPKISSVSVLSWPDDQGDHSKQAIAVIDDDSSTSWHSHWFENNQFLNESAVTLVVKLERTATVLSMTLEMDPSTSGGQLVVYNVTDLSNPRNETQLVTSALSPSTEIKLSQPVEASMFALSFRSIPTSVDGSERVWVSELSVQQSLQAGTFSQVPAPQIIHLQAEKGIDISFNLVPGLVTAPVVEPSEKASLPAPRPSSELPESAKIHDVIIVGSGPAGYTATIYTACTGLNPLVLAGATNAGDALMNTTEMENFPGFPEGVQGPELMDKMRGQAEKFGTEIRYEDITAVNLSGGVKVLALDDELLYARSVILATGSEYRRMNVEGEDRLPGRGVSCCTTCDGFFFKDKVLAMVDGGDSVMEGASFLANFAPKVVIAHRRDTLCTLKSMTDRATANPKIEFKWNVVVDEVLGDETVRGPRLRSTVDESIREIGVDGVFAAIGHLPHTGFLIEDVTLDGTGYIMVEKPSTRMGVEGIFACSGTVDHSYRRAVTAAGSGCRTTPDVEY